ncbi:hypothetical protein NLJ89_g8067 [Agrocybe chaxingu]|uniref:Mucoidy inhibitor A n=1 Tax=Agrocybe chaxingu TaxID=84603 RepID=A0A9W8MSH6_9AGAR|nr:hypothetical protein NLJ89_g8067 [Agrocybe chaxingu]
MTDLSPRSSINLVEVAAGSDSKIARVSLYSGLAEITRMSTVSLKAGDNRVVISGLSNSLIRESLRVEGRGPCTIHEVSISEIPVSLATTTSPKLTDLLDEKACVEKALKRCRQAISAVDGYHDSLDVEHIQANRIAEFQRGINSVAEELDKKLLALEDRLEMLAKSITDERAALGEVKAENQLRQRVSMSLYVERDCEVELVIVYGVSNATWDATYDIYVKMNTKEKPVRLLYKGAITQNTGEDWQDVALTLETVTPSFGVGIPELQPWTLSIYRPPRERRRSGIKLMSEGFDLQKRKREMADSFTVDEEDALGIPFVGSAAAMPKRILLVSSKGDINATFSVPGLMSIPSDGAAHNVTISELSLEAEMSWVSVPKVSPKAHLTAKIKNDSEYTFLRGVASIYVDGSFISRSDVPAVSPQESFDCPLGIDPTIRITYHPRSKKINRSGFTRKTCSYLFDQRVTVLNTKGSAVSNLKIQEQVPVSEDSSITVNLLNPSLVLPHVNRKGVLQTAEAVKVMEHVRAEWDGMGEADVEPSLVGKEGRFNWICEVPSQGKLNLTLSWEVACPYGTDIMGLDG